MKFVALALTLLLAAGCHCDIFSLLDQIRQDLNSQHDQMKSTIVDHLTQAKHDAKKVIDRLDDAEYSKRLTNALDNIQIFLESTLELFRPIALVVVSHIVDKISDMRQKMATDLQNLHSELEPKLELLLEEGKKHLKEYQEELDPVIKEYTQGSAEKMKDVREKIKATMGKLEEKLKVNLEQTKSKLTPIEATLWDKITPRVVELREIVGPYVQQYKKQIETSINNMQRKYKPGEFQKKMTTMVEELQTQLVAIIQTINNMDIIKI